MNTYHFEITEEDRQLLESAGSENVAGLSAGFLETALTPETVGSFNDAGKAEIITVFVDSLVNKSVIDALPNLKLLVTRSTGFDHIDSAYAASKGITVCNVPSYGSRTVAEFTFALMLGLSRKLFQAIEQVKLKNDWDTDAFEGFNLQGKTLGIIGTGRIGLNVAQIAKGFDMQIIAYDPYPNEQKAKDYGFRYAPLNEVLAGSDVVTLHVPATKETHHMINTENVTRFKKGALLINTSRGDVADPEAILAGLQQGYLSGAGLDVLEAEHELKEGALLAGIPKDKLNAIMQDHILMNRPDVIITPHIAFNAREARRDIITTTLKNITSFLAGTPENKVAVL